MLNLIRFITLFYGASSLPYQFPGVNLDKTEVLFGRRLNLPYSPSENLQGGFVVGNVDQVPSPPDEAFINVPIAGTTLRLPKGIYSLNDSDTEYIGDFSLPNILNPVSFIDSLINGKSGKRELGKRTQGLYLPMPFGLPPVALQLVEEDVDGGVEETGVGSNHIIGGPPRENILMHMFQDSIHTAVQTMEQNKAKRQQLMSPCLYNLRRCQLNTLSRKDQFTQQSPFSKRLLDAVQDPNLSTRFTHGLMEMIMPKLMEATASATPLEGIIPFGGHKNKKQVVRAKGIHISFPGFKPVYIGGYVDQKQKIIKNYG